MVRLDDIGKRYQRQWIFQGVNQHFEKGKSYALLGPNGSGKSTLMQIVSAILSPTVGKVHYDLAGQNLSADDIYRQLSFSAPYLELVEEFTLLELINFHRSFKPLVQGMSSDQLIQRVELQDARHKQIRNYSSGMKQRVRLGLALLTRSEIVLLDEPTNNLDVRGIDWYRALVQEHRADRLLIIASNQAHEYDFCEHQVNIQQWK